MQDSPPPPPPPFLMTGAAALILVMITSSSSLSSWPSSPAKSTCFLSLFLSDPLYLPPLASVCVCVCVCVCEWSVSVRASVCVCVCSQPVGKNVSAGNCSQQGDNWVHYTPLVRMQTARCTWRSVQHWFMGAVKRTSRKAADGTIALTFSHKHQAFSSMLVHALLKVFNSTWPPPPPPILPLPNPLSLFF